MPASIDPTQEIRFAVVMYGGSSLSIYMYGVAQELLRLVRATARDPKVPQNALHEASGSERAYRELGQRLVRGQPVNLGNIDGEGIHTRFVIDLLSGTSAGGINSVFLAKALANDSRLDALRDLWVDQADFAELLNDRQGGAKAHQKQKVPKSLVNSPFMYSLLKGALDAMDSPKRDPKIWISPYAEQLDLFTTFTDVQGRVISLKLSDRTATERQHLHSFHFVYSTGEAGFEKRNDFESGNNPFLAFAARSSSAHQAAFEPMTLEDIAKEKNCDPHRTEWRMFYQEYMQPEGRSGKPSDFAKEFQKRPLVDGGTLDNSPFTFAIDQLRFRHVTVPVDRKLITSNPIPAIPKKNTTRMTSLPAAIKPRPIPRFRRNEVVVTSASPRTAGTATATPVGHDARVRAGVSVRIDRTGKGEGIPWQPRSSSVTATTTATTSKTIRCSDICKA